MGFAIFGLALIAYWTSYLTLWARVARLRGSKSKLSALPGNFSFLVGIAAFTYLWSGRHREADDPRLTRLVFVTRIAQLFVPIGAVIFLSV